MIGKTLGHYKILEQLGRGGMGEVYLADDTTLDRKVALKFLPEVFTGDPERMARFEREAKLLASLNHPNIAAIYGLEQADGKRFLIMEYVEGETVQTRISKGALPLEEALGICKQIAEGLEAAHEKGVIHRDLKPANVMITGEEKVKILDFGLAKALSDEIRSVDSSQSPTITEAMTQPGVVLGTAAYMSPEQAKGKAVDKRADIWAFGCILYECLTGKRAFEGDTVTEILAAVIKEDPDIEKAPVTARQLLRQCLAKDRKNRLRDIGDAMILIESSPGDVTSVPAQRTWIAWGVSAISLLLVLVCLALYFFNKPVTQQEMSLQAITPETSEPASLAVSPDGASLVFVASQKGQQQLWLRKLDEEDAFPIEGTEGATLPFWSPDSRSVGFFADAKLKTKDIAGGPVQTLADAPSGKGGTWNNEGDIIFSPRYIDRLYRVSDIQKDPVPVTQLDSPQEYGHWYPQFLLDGKYLLYSAWEQDYTLTSYVTPLDSFEPKRLISSECQTIYVSPGYLLFIQQGNLFAQKIDVEKGNIVGDPIAVPVSVVLDPSGVGGFSVSEAGLLAYRKAGSNYRHLVWFDRSGNEIGALVSASENFLTNPEISSDGKQILADRRDKGNYDIWQIDRDGGIQNKKTFHTANEQWPVWSHDGSKLVFLSTRNGPGDIYFMSSNSAGNEEVLLDRPNLRKIPVAWSPDGKHIIYVQFDPETHLDIWVLPLLSGEPEKFVVTEAEEGDCQFSPDGRWVAYQSNESGIFEIYVKSFPDKGGWSQISDAGGIEARWNEDGTEIYYIAPDGTMMAAQINTSGESVVVKARNPLFQTRVTGGGTPAMHPKQRYVVTDNGQRFLIDTEDQSNILPITIVTNWTRLLMQ